MTSPYRNRKKVVIKPRFYLFLAIFVAILIWIVFAIVNAITPPTVRWGKLSTDQEISAVIIRQEQIVYATESGKFEGTAAEGTQIAQGDEVALLYKSEFNEEDVDSLIDVRQKIKNYQEESILKNVIHEDLVSLDDQIDALINEITVLVIAGKDRALAAKEYELGVLMEERRLYLNENLHTDSTLEARFLSEEVLLDKIEKNITHILAPSSGIISFFLDGLETYLTLERVESINIDDYLLIEDRILNSTIESNINVGSIVAQEQPIYRIIDPNHWYAIIKMPRAKNTLVKGGMCEITFENYGHTLSNVYVSDVRQYGKEVIIVLEFSSDIGPLASLRLVSGNLGRSNEGYVVPLEYLVDNNGQQGVWVTQSDKSVLFIPVNIIAQNYVEAIVEEAEGTSYRLEDEQGLKKP